MTSASPTGSLQLAERLSKVETSAIRELFKLLGRPGIISFAGGFPDPAMFDLEGIQEATRQVMHSPQAAAVLQYGATEGFPAYREAVASLLSAQGAVVQPEQVLTTTGGQQALDLIGKTMVNPGDKVIVEGPTFLATIQCFRLYGAELLSVPVDADGTRVDVLEQMMVEHRPRLVYLIPSFGNPSGAMMTLERRRRVLELAAKHRVLVVEDNPYAELYFGAAPPPSLLALSREVEGSRDWLAYCGSFSKVLSPGIRAGYLVAPPSLMANAVMCKQFSDAHTSNLSQAIAAQYLGLGRMAAAMDRVRAAYAQRARVMAESLREHLGPQLAFDAPKGGMFFWARLTAAGADADQLAKRAIEKQVAFVPGAPFFASNPDRATLRLSFATTSEDKIREGVARLREAL